VFLPDPASYGQHDDIFIGQDPIDSAAHWGDVFRSVPGKLGAFVRRVLVEPLGSEQSCGHSQAKENKWRIAWMSDVNIANFADIADFANFAKAVSLSATCVDPPGIDAIGT
jgi:hypothetical protein